MSRFNHSVCDQCWAERHAGEPEPVRLREPRAEACCYCGREHKSGIRYGEDPERVACGGISGIHKEGLS